MVSKAVIRVYLFLFIAAILVWLVTSNYEFIYLINSHGRVAELPEWVKGMTPLARGIFLNLAAPQLPYWFIAVGLFIELFKSRIALKWNGDRFLTFLSVILIVNGFIAIVWNGIWTGFEDGWYDTMFYGVGFGILFLLRFDARSKGLRFLSWVRLIEVWGPGIGYTVIPATFGIWTSGAGHFARGLSYMLSSPYFWNDITTAIVSVVGVSYILIKGGSRLFWIVSFSIGAIIVGLALTKILPAVF